MRVSRIDLQAYDGSVETVPEPSNGSSCPFASPIASIGYNLERALVQVDEITKKLESQPSRYVAPLGRVIPLCGPLDCSLRCYVVTCVLAYALANADPQISDSEAKCALRRKELAAAKDAQFGFRVQDSIAEYFEDALSELLC
ncbi:MAG: hypothetical protein OXQ31_25575 [Spirochaetaceae bacterium]|nr:hypothetical protein [Spirochaetaceae bacterium]